MMTIKIPAAAHRGAIEIIYDEKKYGRRRAEGVCTIFDKKSRKDVVTISPAAEYLERQMLHDDTCQFMLEVRPKRHRRSLLGDWPWKRSPVTVYFYPPYLRMSQAFKHSAVPVLAQ